MKTNNFNINYIAIVALFFTIFSSCSMIKELEYEVTQDPLHMKGGDVTLQINGKFIEKGLNAKAVAEITPIFFCKDGNEIPFQTEIYQGPKAAGNGKVVPSTGLQFSYTSTIPYQKSMDEGEVKVKVLVKMGSKTEDIMSPKIADGTIITSKLISLDDHVISSSECNFKRINSFTKSATINFSKGKHNVSSKELRDSDVKGLLSFISSSLEEGSRIDIKSIQISSFASPEGEVDLNDNLAQDRGNSTMKSLISKSKRMKFDLGKESSFYNVVSKGEDWEGFKTARFIKTVKKINNKLFGAGAKLVENDDSEHVFIKTDSKLVQLKFKDILWVEALGNYVRVHTELEKHTVLTTMKELQAKLPNKEFLRVQRSFIVRLDQIKSIEDNYIIINDKEIHIGKSYKDELTNRLNLL